MKITIGAQFKQKVTQNFYNVSDAREIYPKNFKLALSFKDTPKVILSVIFS